MHQQFHFLPLTSTYPPPPFSIQPIPPPRRQRPLRFGLRHQSSRRRTRRVSNSSPDKPFIFHLTGICRQTVVLVGHTNCGGAAACLQAANDAAAHSSGEPQPDTPLTRWLGPLTQLVQSLDLSACSASEALNKVVEANIIMQVDNLCKSEPITAAWADPNAKKVTVHGWVYDLAEGRIKELVSRDGQCNENDDTNAQASI